MPRVLTLSTLVFTAAALSAACRPAGGGSPARPAPEADSPATPELDGSGQDPQATPDQEPAAPAATAPRLLDLSGAYGNRVELEGNSGLGSASFPFAPKLGGVFLLSGFRYEFGTCNKETLGARIFLHAFDEAGKLKEVFELEVLKPLRITKNISYQLNIVLKSHEQCAGASVTTSLRYFAPRPTEPAGEGGDAGDDGVGEGDGDGGDGTDGTDGTDGSNDGGDGVDPDRPTCPPLAERSDLPATLKGGFVLHARNSVADGCKPQLAWKLTDHMRSLDPPSCSLPKARFDVKNEAATTFRAIDARPDFDFNLFWIRIPDPARALTVKLALQNGETVDVIAGPEDCPDLPRSSSTLVLDSDLDLVLFEGDPRDACLANGQPAQVLDVAPAASTTFQVFYQYGAADAAHFHWKVSFALPQSQATGSLKNGARARVYNIRTRAFVTDWVPLTGPSATPRLEVTDPASLRRILPYQQDLEILLSPSADDLSCSVAYVLPYHRHFRDSALNPRFTDGTRAGRSRHQLVEQDLPN